MNSASYMSRNILNIIIVGDFSFKRKSVRANTPERKRYWIEDVRYTKQIQYRIKPYISYPSYPASITYLSYTSYPAFINQSKSTLRLIKF